MARKKKKVGCLGALLELCFLPFKLIIGILGGATKDGLKSVRKRKAKERAKWKKPMRGGRKR